MPEPLAPVASYRLWGVGAEEPAANIPEIQGLGYWPPQGHQDLGGCFLPCGFHPLRCFNQWMELEGLWVPAEREA